MPRRELDDKHEVPWHEHMHCTVCAKDFWGDCAFREHVPCGETEMRGKYVMRDGLHVLKCDVTYYHQVTERVKKAREGKGGDGLHL